MPHTTQQTNEPVNPEVTEVLGSPPGLIVRAGNTLLFVITALALTVAGLITYPEVMNGRVIIHPQQSITISSPATTTQLVHQFVQDGNAVQQGAPILVLKHIATEQHDTLHAPFSGIVFFRKLFSPQDPIQPQMPLIAVQDHARPYKVQLHTTAYGSGKIKPGQEVLISLDQFPGDTFGELTATITSRPVADSTGQAVAEAVLQADLSRIYGYYPDMSAGATGFCNIITGRKSFLSKLIR